MPKQTTGTDDRRVKYTKRVIKDALIELLQQKSIEKITVKELCEAADVNRSTFYAHFSNPAGVLHRIEQETYADITAYVAEFSPEDEGEAPAVLTRIFDYMIQNDGILRVLLSDNAAPDFGRSLMRIASEQVTKEWAARAAAPAATLDSAFIFIINGAIGIVRKWLDDGLSKSAEEMSDLIFALALGGLSSYLK
ncbi:AcrR family transcriptional regulator [Clostridia bacterium]|nr:AcrR family transcriptional regulator [Clostridia bacterium]